MLGKEVHAASKVNLCMQNEGRSLANFNQQIKQILSPTHLSARNMMFYHKKSTCKIIHRQIDCSSHIARPHAKRLCRTQFSKVLLTHLGG
ncbi:hypothetical protein H9Q10_05795 [Eikenella sp. S3360]|uniref:Uncharacterized protein n=1 Tax=Eikenella glucosivorans TaxID=2766967 RepID=A0ABS0NA53_9NEIS|nr:hypothetical protein [Eikenella glucosivorans]MBH5329179.1 hypothetical protein [Eikenella glucosivorans]